LTSEERLRFIRAIQAARRYVPQPYGGRVDLFRAEKFAVSDPDLGWRAYALGGVRVHVVPGDHLSIIREPYVRHLGDRLRTVIDNTLFPDIAPPSERQSTQ
jgi:thioesterase domain-containing protein